MARVIRTAQPTRTNISQPNWHGLTRAQSGSAIPPVLYLWSSVMNLKNSILVVLGTGSDNKPHAARFEGSDETLVRKAAGLMGFRIGRAETEEARALAKKLPEGKVFAAGRALVPYVKQDLFDQIRGLLIIEQATTASPNAEPALAPPHKNGTKVAATNSCSDPWSDVKIGSVVLCREDVGEDSSWWESVVVAIAKDGETMTMRWRDYPKVKKFTVRRHTVGLIAQTAKSALG